jgi:hypothetical protein
VATVATLMTAGVTTAAAPIDPETVDVKRTIGASTMTTACGYRKRVMVHISALRAWAAVVALAGCAAPGPVSTASEPADTSASTAPSTSSGGIPLGFGERIDIGDGRSLYLECLGSGPLTVLLESGDEADSSQWDLVYSDLGAESP